MSNERGRTGRWAAIGLGLLVAVITAPTAWAQVMLPASESAATTAPVTLPDPMTKEAVRDLLARLDDDQARQLLLAELDRAIIAKPVAEQEGVMDDVGAGVAALRESWRGMAAAVVDLPGVPGFYLGKLLDDRGPSELLFIALAIVVIYGVAWGVERGFGRVIRHLRRQVEEAQPESALAKLGYCILRIAVDWLGIVVYAVAALAIFFTVFYQGQEAGRHTMMAILGSVIVVRLVASLARFVLAPRVPSLRMLPVDDETAGLLHRRIVWLAVVGIGFLWVDLLWSLGIDPHVAGLLNFVLGAVFVGMLIALVWRGREPVAALIRGDNAKALPADAGAGLRLRHLAAGLWHGFATLYILLLWAMAEVSRAMGIQTDGAGLKSLLLVVAVPLVDAAIGQAIEGLVATRGEEVRSYGRVARRALRVLLIILAIGLFGALWGIDLFDFAAGGMGERAIAAMVDVGLTLLVAYVGWEVAKIAIDRRLASEGGHGEVAPGSEGGGHGAASRISTLLPLFRKFLMVTLGVMVIMLVLSSLGVDIGPLLAGAGVIGLAIGFGAQTLVRDIVSGVFFLTDDAFRIGEYVDIGSVRGTVESISIRSLRLRHHRGAVHTIPFGEIQYLTNYSRDWVIMKLMFRVPYDTDLTKVKKIFKKIGAEMMADPLIGPNLLDPPKSQGVLEIDDSAMVIRAKFMAKPGEQFVIRRVLFEKVQQEFEAAGILFARKQVSVYVPPGATVDTAAVAAAVAAEEQAQAKAAG